MKRSICPTKLIRKLCVILLVCVTVNISHFAQDLDPIKLSWLGGNPPALSTGVSWGVPLPEGKINPSDNYLLKNDQGLIMPVQSWPLAYWPDGSLKWVGLSTVVDTTSGMTFQLEPVKTTGDNHLTTKIEVTENSDNIIVNTGVIQCDIPKQGEQLIRFIKMDEKRNIIRWEIGLYYAKWSKPRIRCTTF